jgi:hypothetical protein
MGAQKLQKPAICGSFGRRPKKDFKQKHFGIRFSLQIPVFLAVKILLPY